MVRLAILGGAGISAASHIPTFSALRSKGMLDHRFITYSHIKGYLANPLEANRTYDEFLQLILDTKPNTAHEALKTLQKNPKIQFINQNIDGFGGGIPLHGRIKEIFCTACGNITPFSMPFADYHEHYNCDCCKRSTPHRRNLVLSGESSYTFESALKAVYDSHKVIVVGTELRTKTAATLVETAALLGKDIELWNPEPLSPEVMRHFSRFREGKAEVLLPALARELA